MNKLTVLVAMLVSAAAWAADPWIGLELDRSFHGAAKVRGVIAEAPGQRAGIGAGDQVVALDAKKIESADALIAAVHEAGVGKNVKLKVVNATGKARELVIKLEARPEMGVVQRGSLVGKPAPDFEPAVRAGAKFPKISTLKGQVVLIDFFATWCGPCVAMMPHIEKMHEELGARGLKVLGVSSEAAATVAGAAGRFGLKYPLASDEDEGVSTQYRIYALPTMVVIDRQGVVREVAIADPEAVDAAVQAALAGK